METKTQTTEKDYIAKLGLTATCRGGANTWGRTSFQFDILFGRFSTPFKFYGSVVEYQADKQTLSDSELLFAYKCIISDAYCIVEVDNSRNEFLEMFGYLDSEHRGEHPQQLEYILTDEEFKTYESGVTAWEGCKSAKTRLNKTDDELCEILDELQELGIE